MQHPDEGTIHSWLDGALSADEAARVEEHVKECPQCAAAVAEARGFIAGASRILTALDNAPRGVIPAVAPMKRIDPWIWRVAATVLVVAAGTLVVVRNQGGTNQRTPALADSATMLQQRGSIAEGASAVIEPAQIAADAATPKAAASNAPKIARREKTGVRDSSSGIPAFENKVLERRNATQAPQSAAVSGYVGNAAPPTSTFAPVREAGGFAAMDSASQSVPLKVVGTPRRIGAKVTLYEVAPGDTVTLMEAVPISLDAVVVTSVGEAPMMAKGASKSARSTGTQSKVRDDAAAIAKASDSSRTAGAPSSAPAITARALASQAGIGSALHAITWTDSATRNTLTLTGRMPEARLQEIRVRIERERAAAAAKRSP